MKKVKFTFSFTIHWEAGRFRGTGLIVETFPSEDAMRKRVKNIRRNGIGLPQRDATFHLTAENITLIESRELDDPTDN